MFIDTHSHPYTEEFNDDREAVIARAMEAGADLLLLPNIDEASIEPMLSLCHAHPDLCRPMMGLHPTELPPTKAETLRVLQKMEHLLEVPNNPYVAIGEVGIDLYWDDSRCEEQIEVLRHQAAWAVRFRLPLVIHSRSAHRQLIDTLLPFEKDLVGGIFHCFGGNEEEAAELLKLFPRFVLGIGGVVTFKKSTLPQTLAAVVPLGRIVLETDCPYLAPTPHRGKRNEPSFIPFVIEKLAEIYNTSAEEIAKQTSDTAHRVFKL